MHFQKPLLLSAIHTPPLRAQKRGEVNEVNAELWIPEPPSLLLITMIKYWHSDCT